MADYTFPSAVVLIEATGTLAIGATGVLRPSEGGDPVQVYDLNGSPIPAVVVGSKGVHQPFQADIPDGVLDFGSVLLTAISQESMTAAITAELAATSAEAAAVAAAASAAAAEAGLELKADLDHVHAGGGGGSGVDLLTVPSPLGAAAPGDNALASPSDHVHDLPKLGELENVDTTGVADGQVMAWSSGTAKFVPVNIDPGVGAIDYADVPTGSTFTKWKHPTTGWGLRPTSRADIHFIWKGPDPAPSVVASGTGGMHDNTQGYGDTNMVTP